MAHYTEAEGARSAVEEGVGWVGRGGATKRPAVEGAHSVSDRTLLSCTSASFFKFNTARRTLLRRPLRTPALLSLRRWVCRMM
jgi:hypothetical protein